MTPSTCRERDRILIGTTTWMVDRVSPKGDGARYCVGLIDEANPKHGTAFDSQVLDSMIAEGKADRLDDVMATVPGVFSRDSITFQRSDRGIAALCVHNSHPAEHSISIPLDAIALARLIAEAAAILAGQATAR